ncbi:DUF4097 family beta strand repeat-containing protein [Nocardioides speluncae]|uniref:DUF4097 family beta strand repeat-containing protein n=1 Tax=Nocardioides speluncae TaxID=2670337 RepID=UPI000D68F9BF|nr:DUF4097 family beta strand repeat-containing protein [Nocardioides speluncae]
MNERTEQFKTPEPITVHVEIGKGTVTVTATETTETTVLVSGKHADQVRVDQTGRGVSVVEPRRLGFGDDVHVTATVPTGSTLSLITGSADIEATGIFAGGSVKSGSGDVRLDHLTESAVLETGSGDITVSATDADLKVKSGSGDLRVGRVGGAITVSTGSGDIEIGESVGEASAKTGSGDLRIGRAGDSVSLMTGSGDLSVDSMSRGRLSMKSSSGDVRVGIPSGTPVWTDVSSLTGRISSNLAGVGAPEEGADYVELRAKTVTGDVVLTQV